MSEFKAKDIVAMNVPSLPEPVGSLQELHPEFAKVLHENFLELIGDDFPIENRISPNCKVTEAHINEADKLNRLG
ncbi:hypothetical protein [Acinetobacter geminorum]|uniref:hypothetical protein n=1 Tax=Acinetobacter geminorum TaxID=2730922 RepID=UPI0014783561|nr:hypothetical protein [Acinetobacter geminorum]